MFGILSRATFLLCWGALCTVPAVFQSVQGQPAEFRGLWVDAWGAGFLNGSQTTQLIADCRRYNFNAVVVQMRRRGDAFYMPQLPNREPRTTALPSTYDALADLIDQAHSGSPRIEVHCWAPANLIWSGTTLPAQLSHVYRAHPEYLMKDSRGEIEIAEGSYLDPGNPDAMLWNYHMAMDIVRRYDIDGFHWDYIRYPQQDAGYNEVAIARYKQEFNTSITPAPTDNRFSMWRRRQVTDFLRWVNADLLELKPNLIISAAVFASQTDAFNARFQDWSAWNTEGIIDICMPMNYTANNASIFIPRADDAFNRQGVRGVYMGQGAYLNTKENTLTQLSYARAKGFPGTMFYSYRTPNSGTPSQTATFDYIKANHQPAWLGTPPLSWKSNPSKGITKGTILRADTRQSIYNATVTLHLSAIKTQRSEPHGKFAFFEVPAGASTLTASAPGFGLATNSVTVAAGFVSHVDLLLPIPAAPGEQITITTWSFPTDERLRIQAEGGAGVRYVLQGSFDLLTWSDLQSQIAPAKDFEFTVITSAEFQFFRLRGLP